MPTVSVSKEQLFKKLGVSFTEEEFDNLCFQFGIELDEVSPSESNPKDLTYKIDIGANRYDLLCLEGITRSLSIFLGRSKPPIYKAIRPDNIIKTIVKPSTKGVRPFVVTAVLRGVNVDQLAYNSIIDLQEKLHWNICRKRSLVAIGVHDLSTISPPFIYSADPPTEIKFKPLNQTKVFNAVELMEFYKTDSHLKPYLPIIRDEPLYPVIRDSNGVVLSMPPIINGDHSKVNQGRIMDLFFECTATDENKAIVVLDTLITMISEHAGSPFTAELTEVVYEEGSKFFPVLEYRDEIIDVTKANKIVGVSSTIEEISTNLEKMCLVSKPKSTTELAVSIPPTRHDVIHACDIYEDIAISYGYDKILQIARLPPSMTVARQFPLNKLTDLLRESAAQAGYTEALTFSLCSIDDECEKLRVPRPTHLKNLALISNPKTLEFQTCRYSMLPGLLKTIQANKKMPLPLKLFEISDVVRMSKDTDTGCVNLRHFCAVYYNKSPGFEQIHGLLDRMMQLLEVTDYQLRASDNPTFFDGRCAEIIYNGNVIGHIGVLHPEVCTGFELVNPASAVEFCIENFL